jgi:DNA-binding PadR family transcriptional regulator
MLILRMIVGGPMHGYEVAKRIHNLSDDVLCVEDPSARWLV